MRPYLITAKLMRPSNMKRFPTTGLDYSAFGLLLSHSRAASLISIAIG
jgi:hypothetical protein